MKAYLAGLPHGLRDVPKGAYFLTILHKPTGRRWALIDSSGLFHAFVSGPVVSSSFLALAKRARVGPADLNHEGLIEFFHFGNVFLGKTLFSGIRRIGYDEIICLDPSGKVEIVQKGVPDISCSPQTSPYESLEVLASSAMRDRVSVDLTGGMDSRMLAVILDSLGLNFEVAVSGSPGNREIYVAEQIARILRRDLNVHYHDISDFPASVRASFLACDGLFSPTVAHCYLQMQQARARRGITLAIKGDCGELLRDFYWLQDFPFYARRKTNLARLYSARLFPLRLCHHYLSPTYRSASEQFRSRFLRSMAPFASELNTQTYDRIVYRHIAPDYSGRMVTLSRDCLSCLAPYLERDVVAFGYALPRTKRFFDYYHRETITSINSEAARVLTPDRRMTVSSRYIDVSADLLRYTADFTKRLNRVLRRKLFQETHLTESPEHPDFLQRVRELTFHRRTLERLKDHQILSPLLKAEEIRDDYWGNLIGLDLLVDELGW